MDIDGDFIHDIIVAGGTGGTGGPRRVFALSGMDGDLIWQAAQEDASFYALTLIDDVTGDQIPDVAAGTGDGIVYGYNGDTGDQLWLRNVNGGATSSPVFELVNMGNSNPDVNMSDDLAIASAYDGVWCVDGLTGALRWRYHLATGFVYEVAAGSDITGDDIREVYAGLVSGHVLCLDGALGTVVWDAVADPVSPANILSMTNVPDMTGDGIEDIVCGTLGDHVVVLDGWTGVAYFATQGTGPFDAMDVVGIIPDIDNNGSWEVLAGNREGVFQVLAGGAGIPGPAGYVMGIVRSIIPNEPIMNAEVSADGTDRLAFTDSNGSYTLALAPGTYTIRVRRAGFCEVSFDGIVVIENMSTTRNASMLALYANFNITSLNVLVGSDMPHVEEFEITNNNGGCALEFSISDTSDWLTCFPPSGEVLPNQTQVIAVTFDASGLSAGDYQSSISIEHNDENSPYRIPVAMNVFTAVDPNASLPTEYKLYSAYPNPFNPSTTIAYDLAADSHVRIVIYNSLGSQVTTLLNHTLPRGHYQVVWNGTDNSGGAVGTGIYFLRFETLNFEAAQKIVLIK